jgi:membrane-associated phospholipid phosphatase
VPSPRVVAIARFTSIAGHPFVFIPAAIVFSGASRPSAAPAGSAGVVAAIVALGMLVIGAYVGHGLHTGRWSNIDVSVREQRGGLYRVALGATAAAAVAFAVEGLPVGVRGSLIAFGLVLVSALVNLRLKISLHVAFAAYAVGIAAGRRLDVLLVASLLAVAIAWSRLVLRRHTPAEVLAGAVAGSIAGAAFVLILGYFDE